MTARIVSGKIKGSATLGFLRHSIGFVSAGPRMERLQETTIFVVWSAEQISYCSKDRDPDGWDQSKREDQFLRVAMRQASHRVFLYSSLLCSRV